MKKYKIIENLINSIFRNNGVGPDGCHGGGPCLVGVSEL